MELIKVFTFASEAELIGSEYRSPFVPNVSDFLTYKGR